MTDFNLSNVRLVLDFEPDVVESSSVEIIMLHEKHLENLTLPICNIWHG